MNTKRGFVALISIIIVSAILLILLFALNTSSFFNRFDALDAENKRESQALAESCVSAAMLKLALNNAYQPAGGKECVSAQDACPTGPKVCVICPITNGAGASKVIVARAVYGGTYTNLSVTFDPTPGVLSIINWSELASNPIPSCTAP